jgi:hypothetical protein
MRYQIASFYFVILKITANFVPDKFHSINNGMKKVVLSLFMAAAFTLAVCAQDAKKEAPEAAKIHHNKYSVSFETKAVIGKSVHEFGADIFQINASYLYNVSDHIGIGIGAGIGTVDALKYWLSMEERDSKIAFSFFGRGKYKFTTKPTSLFLLLDIGYNTSSFEGWSEKSYNPLGFFMSPRLGIDIGLSNKNVIAFSAGLHGQNTQYTQIQYDREFKKKGSLESGGFSGLTLSVEYIF